MEDSYGFPSAPTTSQRSRFRVRAFTAANTWSLRFPSLAAALAGSPSDLASLSLAHGVPAGYRADVWLRCARAVGGARPLDYEKEARDVFSISDANALEVARQIEIDLPRTFAEQRDFAAALAARAARGGALDGSRASAAAAAQSATASVGGDVHDALRRLLRVFCARNMTTGYLQSMNFIAAFLLLVFGREREAQVYQVFEILVTCILPGYYTPTMGLLRCGRARSGEG